VIRIEIHKRVSKKIRDLGPEAVAEAEKRLSQLAEDFGKPHSHSGLGLRKIARRNYEIRVWLQWRIVLVDNGGWLLADDVLNHDGVSVWLKTRGNR
jgi:hypothetical protein